jgi:hypothetical protein
MLSDWQLLGVLAVSYAAGHQIIIALPRRRRALEREENQTLENRASKFPSIPKPDFYGVKVAESDPESFQKNVRSLQEKLEAGQEVPVVAQEAFFLMRNIQHHDLIVGETGTLNMNILSDNSGAVSFDEDKIEAMSKMIMNFQPSGSDDKILKRKALPKYIKESVQLKCGGVRWVFQDWHANECGMPSLCYDKNGRPMPDPDIVIEEKGAKGKKSKGSEPSAIGNLVSEISRMSEIVSDIRGEQILKSDVLPVTENDTAPSLKNCADEVVLLEDKHPIPNFLDEDTNEDEAQHAFFGFGEEVEIEEVKNDNDVVKIISKEENQAMPFMLPPYQNMDVFLKTISGDQTLINCIFDVLCSADGNGKVLVDIPSRELLIEKNYFIQTLRGFLQDSDKSLFDADFLTQKSIEIYDVSKVNSILDSLDLNGCFVRFGAQKKKLLHKNLLSSIDRKEKYYVGWYVKTGFSAHQAISIFLEKYLEGYRVETITSSPKEIETRTAGLKNLNVSY